VTRATASNNKWQRRSREEWREVFARFAASGLEVEAFCAHEGLSVSSFRRWRSLLAAMSAPRSGCPRRGEPSGFVDAGLLGGKVASICGSIWAGA
jgi:putative transposase